MEGFTSDDGHVSLSVFSHEVQSFISLLNGADTMTSGGKQTVVARVVDLSHSSPAAITVELVSKNSSTDTRPQIMSVLQRAGRIREGVDALGDRGRKVLEALGEMAAPVGPRIRRAALSFGSTAIELDGELRHRIALVLEAEETALGSVEGKLEAINIHDNANLFYIYPAVGPTKIKCYFPPSLRDQAIGAVDQNVLVSGVLKYRVLSMYPHEIEAERMERLPKDEELPTIQDIIGIAPDATDGVPSEVFVRRIRDGWV